MLSSSAVIVLFVALACSYWLTLLTSRPPPIANFVQRTPSRFRKAPAALTQTATLRDKTAFVTGAAGFLGSNLVEQLLLQGWHVTALVRPRSNTTLLSGIAAQCNAAARLAVVEGDVTDYASLQRTVPNNVAVVFHVAAIVSLWNGRAQQCYDVNVLGTRNVVDVCLEKNAQKLVHTSSNAVYTGPGLQNDADVTESTPRFGLGNWLAYPYTKAQAETEVLAGISDGQFAVIVNPGGILGKYDINGFARVGRMLKRGEVPAVPDSVQPMGSATAIAKAHIAAAERGVLGRSYNLCGKTQPFQKLLVWAGEAIGVNGDKLVLPSVLLYPVGLFNNFLALFTGNEPDLSFDLLYNFAHERNGCNSDRAVAELGYEVIDTDEKARAAVHESMRWLLANNKLDGEQ
jgi:dihydroflavonol-4-reductase